MPTVVTIRRLLSAAFALLLLASPALAKDKVKITGVGVGFPAAGRGDSVAKFGQSECSHHASRFRLRRCEPFDATDQCSNTGSLAATQTQEIGSQPHSCTSASTIIVIPVLHNTCTYGQVWKILGS